MSDIDLNRYSRQISLQQIGAGGQQVLHDACVLIVGAGGLGNPAALYLASAGVGHFVVTDFDTIDKTNLPRQILFRDADVGQPKAATLTTTLHDINPSVQTRALDVRLNAAQLAEHCATADVVLDCTDNFVSRWAINKACFKTGTPLVTGAAIRFEGQIAVFRLDTGKGPCYRCLYSENDQNLDDCAGQGILAPVAGTIGSMMATEAIKVLLDINPESPAALWIYDAETGQTRTLQIPARDDCPVCASG